MVNSSSVPLVAGFSQAHLGYKPVSTTIERWCFGRTNPSRVGSEWSYCGSYDLRMDSMSLRRNDDGKNAKHSHEGQALVLIHTYIGDSGEVRSDITVLDTRIGGMPRSTGEPAPVLPDALELQIAVGTRQLKLHPLAFEPPTQPTPAWPVDPHDTL